MTPPTRSNFYSKVFSTLITKYKVFKGFKKFFSLFSSFSVDKIWLQNYSVDVFSSFREFSMVLRNSFSHTSSLLYSEWDDRPARIMWECALLLIVQMVERPSINGKVSGSIPRSVTFSHCWYLVFIEHTIRFACLTLTPTTSGAVRNRTRSPILSRATEMECSNHSATEAQW